MLIVHEHPDEAYALRRVVASAATRVMVAHGCAEGLRAAREMKPDLILSDLNGENDDSFDLRRRLLLDYELSRIPFVFISAARSKEAQLEALRLGAADYLLKPLNADTLSARLVHFLEARRVNVPVDAALSGPLDMITCPSLLQCLDWNRSTGILHLSNAEHAGHFVFSEGYVIDARVGALSGEDAAFEMIWFDEGDFTFDARPASTLAELFPRMRVQNLLVDAGWVKDELAKLEGMAPGDEDVIEVLDPGHAAACFSHPAWASWVGNSAPQSTSAIARMLGIGCQRARVGLGDGIRRGVLRVVGMTARDLVLDADGRGSGNPNRTPIDGARIMLIDDDPEVHHLLIPYFEAAGFQVHGFETGVRAVENAQMLRPAVVIIDGLLPGMLGPQIAQAIRQGPLPPNVQIVLLSSFFKDHAAHRYLKEECGVDLILHKGCDVRTILYEVIELFERTGGHRPAISANGMDVDAELEAIRLRFTDRIPERIEHLRRALDRWVKGDCALLTQEAHRLRGSSGMLGFSRAWELLGELELASSTDGEINEGELRGLINEIEQAFRITPPEIRGFNPQGPAGLAASVAPKSATG